MTPSAAVTMCRTLLDEWAALGVRHAVVAPGSRSTPMALALAAEDRIDVHIFHDERSAAFAALGIGLSTGQPAVLLCTSGTAAAEFFPAVAEASQSCVPMIVCTADRPPELQGVGAPQTMNQQHLYGGYVRSFVNVSPPSFEESKSWRVIGWSSYLSSTNVSAGPVHLNLQFRDPLVGVAADLPPRETSESQIGNVPASDLQSLANLAEVGSGLILAGAGVDDPRALVELSSRLGWPLVADPRSGCRALSAQVITHADSILRHEDSAVRLTPSVILRVGEPPVSKVVNQWVARTGARIVAVVPNGRRIDPEGVVSEHLTCKVGDLVTALAGITASTEFFQLWWEAETTARSVIADVVEAETRVTEPWVARAVASSLREDDLLLLSSSMPVRDVEWFAESCPRAVYSNRGVNGIDGVLSTGIGLALGSGRRVTTLIGDVAFLHDSNALINLGERAAQVRIVVVDNRGGGIFSFLDQAKVLDRGPFERFYGTPHTSNLEALAQAHQVAASTVASKEEFMKRLTELRAGVIVVRTDRDDNVQDHQRINDAVVGALARGARRR
jgi:2-succinyl-5-enolpyruvyl-6-hydroxy-3-cyclohexene-1-carboxylate synthase